jgi:hypothetical protein
MEVSHAASSFNRIRDHAHIGSGALRPRVVCNILPARLSRASDKLRRRGSLLCPQLPASVLLYRNALLPNNQDLA